MPNTQGKKKKGRVGKNFCYFAKKIGVVLILNRPIFKKKRVEKILKCHFFMKKI